MRGDKEIIEKVPPKKKMKIYKYLVLGNGMYKVIRCDDKKKEGDRFQEYIVDMKNFTCGCKAYHYSKPPKTCGHLKFVSSQLRCKDGGILNLEHEGDYDDIM